MNEQRWDDQLEPTYSSSVQIRDVALKTNRMQWTIKGCEKESGISVQMARQDDDDDDESWIIDYLKMYKTTDKVIKFIEKTMKNWKVQLTTGVKSWGENPEVYPGKYAVTITICDSDDST